MAEPYRPSNGSEGADFMAKFCDNCKKDINEDCNILMRALAHDDDEPEYPSEWIEDENGERCTAFEERE